MYHICLGFSSSLIAFLEINLALVNVEADYVSRRLNITRLLCLPISTASLKRVDRERRQTRPLRLWVRPGHKSG